MGRYAAGVVRARLRGREHGAFRYRDKGNLATIGRAAAVADIKGVRLSGFPAWATWLVHLWFLIGFQNRLLVLIRWSFSFATSAPAEERRTAWLDPQPVPEGMAWETENDPVVLTAALGSGS